MRSSATNSPVIEIIDPRRKSVTRVCSKVGQMQDLVTVRLMIDAGEMADDLARSDAITVFIDNAGSSRVLLDDEFQLKCAPMRSRSGFRKWAQETTLEIAEALVASPEITVSFVAWLRSLDVGKRTLELAVFKCEDEELTIGEEFGPLHFDTVFALLLGPRQTYSSIANELNSHLALLNAPGAFDLFAAHHWAEQTLLFTVGLQSQRRLSQLDAAEIQQLLRINKTISLAENWAVERVRAAAANAKQQYGASRDMLEFGCEIQCRGPDREWTDYVIHSLDFSPGWLSLIDCTASECCERLNTGYVNDAASQAALQNARICWSAHRLFFRSGLSWDRILMVNDLWVDLSVTYQLCLPVNDLAL